MAYVGESEGDIAAVVGTRKKMAQHFFHYNRAWYIYVELELALDNAGIEHEDHVFEEADRHKVYALSVPDSDLGRLEEIARTLGHEYIME